MTEFRELRMTEFRMTGFRAAQDDRIEVAAG
jgi:hypothetical protein